MAIYDKLMSPSTANTYLNCPFCFYLKKIRGIEVGSGEAAIFGSFIHYTTEHFWDFYNPESDPEDAIKQAIAKYNAADKLTHPNIQPEYEEVAYTCLNNFVSIIKETPKLIPVHNELRCENFVDRTMAIIDSVYPTKIVDYKTSTQYTVNAKLPNIIQAVMCSQNLLHSVGMEVRQVEFWYLRFKKYQRVTVDAALIEEVNNRLAYVKQSILEDKFPKNESSCFFCDYKLICAMEKRNISRAQRRLHDF